jgi:hypothetical protein
MTYTVKPDRSQLQLQIFDRKTRAYRAVSGDAPHTLEDAVLLYGPAPYRIVDPRKGRPLKPQYHASGYGSRGGAPTYNRSKREVCSQYLQWARDKGLKQVHTFSDGICPTAPGFERVISVGSEAYFNVEETIEGDGYTAIVDDHLAEHH